MQEFIEITFKIKCRHNIGDTFIVETENQEIRSGIIIGIFVDGLHIGEGGFYNTLSREISYEIKWNNNEVNWFSESNLEEFTFFKNKETLQQIILEKINVN